jgi:hypothetical protein
MALITLLLVAVSFGAYVLYKYLESCRSHKVPIGLKPLPGPKGKALFDFLCDNDYSSLLRPKTPH